MARQLKTFETSLGFFDLAIAAPSMKAALQAWGADSNLFHQGAARESKDPDVVAATLAKPGVVLKRPVGSDQPFGETADLPTNLDDHKRRPARVRAKPNKQPPQKTDDKAARKAALAYEKEQKRREAERRKEEAARDKERARREQATVKAQAALDKAEREHETRAAAIDAERKALESRSQAEDARWEKQRRRLDDSLRKART
jgi:colicin import membrane protein